jgi:ankyrin repeat protein
MRLATVLLAAGLFGAGCQKAVSPKGGPATSGPEAQETPGQREVTLPVPQTHQAPGGPEHQETPAQREVALRAPQTHKAPDLAANQAYANRIKQLLEAVDKGRLSLVIELLKKGADVNDKDDDGQTALHRAVAKGHKSLTVALIALGADLGEKDAKGRTPMMLAAEAGNADVLGLLLAPDAASGMAKDALGLAGAELKINLQGFGDRLKGAVSSAQDQTDGEGRTPLMLAAAKGHSECVKRLLPTPEWMSGRTRVLRGDKQGQNALMLAVLHGDAETLDALLDPRFSLTLADLRKADAQGKTALDLAEAGGKKPIIKRLWMELAPKAAAEGELETVKAALEKYPAEITPRDMMFAAAEGGGLSVVQFLMERWRDKPVEEKLRLLTKGTPGANETALYKAMCNQRPDVIKALLDLDWWKDKRSLISFVRTKLGSAKITVLDLDDNYYPEMRDLIRDRLKQVEGSQ